MKKIAAAALSVACALLVFPQWAPARGATASPAAVVDMHGSKTYLGTTSAWSSKWDATNFEDVTDGEVSYDGNLTIKSGTMNDVDVTGGSTLTIQGGTMQDVGCDGAITIQGGTMQDVSGGGTAKVTGGTMKSLEASGNIAISGGTIRHDVTSDGGEVTLSSKVNIGGGVSADDVTISSGTTGSIAGTIQAGKDILLNQCSLNIKAFDGGGTATLEIDGYKAQLPPILNMQGILVDADTKALVGESLVTSSLQIADKGQMITNTSLEVDSFEGPGVLVIPAGKLMVHDAITNYPLLVFSNAVSVGMVAFKADEGAAVSQDAVDLFGFGLDVSNVGATDVFKLAATDSNGVSLDKSSVALNGSNSATVKATIRPSLSDYADGTKVVFTMYGETAAFSMSYSSQTCTVSAAQTGTHRAVLVAYLVDRSGNQLEGYRSAVCALSTGTTDTGSTGNGSTDNGVTYSYPSDVRLDTTVVSILTGGRYGVMATTSSPVMAHAMSYNSSVAVVGPGVPTVDKYGNPGYLYTVTGVGKGQVTIDVAGQKMIATVSGGIIVDTASYNMSPGQKYVIGVQMLGMSPQNLSVFSTNGAVSVAYLGQQSNGVCLYQITGQSSGTASVIFNITTGADRVVQTQVNVQYGISPYGSSSRQVALAR